MNKQRIYLFNYFLGSLHRHRWRSSLLNENALKVRTAGILHHLWANLSSFGDLYVKMRLVRSERKTFRFLHPTFEHFDFRNKAISSRAVSYSSSTLFCKDHRWECGQHYLARNAERFHQNFWNGTLTSNLLMHYFVEEMSYSVSFA